MVLDSDGPPARVAVVEGTVVGSAAVRGYRVSSYAVATRQLCNTTPCAAVLPQGQQQVTFQSVSDGERVLRLATRDREVRNDWRARFHARRERLERFCRRRGIGFLPLRTGDPVDGRLLDRLSARAFGRSARSGGLS